jgi:hypothetical protein
MKIPSSDFESDRSDEFLNQKLKNMQYRAGQVWQQLTWQLLCLWEKRL